MSNRFETTVGGKKFVIETGKIAKQASGSVTVQCEDTVVLVTATATKDPIEDRGFTPLTVDYRERTFAAGKIPGGFFKREGRPSDKETLTSRLIDRPIRPLFPEGYLHDTQIIAVTLSSDGTNNPDVLAITGASAALTLSPAQFLGPIAGVRVGRVDGKLIVNPEAEEILKSDINIVLACTKDGVAMVEGEANIVPEADMLKAIEFGHKEAQPLIKLQEEMAKKAGKEKWPNPTTTDVSEYEESIKKEFGDDLEKALTIPTKLERYSAISELKTRVKEKLGGEDADSEKIKMISTAFSNMKKQIMRGHIVNDGKRIGGRTFTDIRDITSEVGLLPRTHGSALFTRGETQALATITLGTRDDQQIIDALDGEYKKRFMLHYNFPPFSVGEVKFMRGPGRREIGHGTLAERAITPVLPDEMKFPYTIRIVSEILESNGSSSMATICGSSLSLMDAGVPLKAPVAGVAMGLIKDGDKTVILTDILGDEDHLGDMDFKVAGTKDGITALQMDIKITKLSYETLADAMKQAHSARMHILGKMEETLSQPREELSQFAPKLTVLQIPTAKIGDLIGPGGKIIRMIIAETGATIDVDDDGIVNIAAVDQSAGEAAIKMVKRFTASPKVGKYYKGKVVRIADFGAFVEIFPKTDGLVHISQLDDKRVEKVTDVLKEGQYIVVKVIEIDKASGKIRLSKKDAVGHENEIEEI